ncbi:MAG: hypothetical protein A2V88_15515 [Elusimicrobia bacterium RBG_16_66_12]|nr:MAG: hypothetical protein A2V88_15515 [Elusimicrobia bacterium RBG_16_66_12]
MEWKPIMKSLPFQPALVFILLGFLAEPIAGTAPWLLRASCEGPLRATLAASFMAVYITVGMPSACAAYYLGFARRRIAPSRPRTIADLSFVLVLAVSAVTLAAMSRGLAARWTALQPALASVRDACWK